MYNIIYTIQSIHVCIYIYVYVYIWMCLKMRCFQGKWDFPPKMNLVLKEFRQAPLVWDIPKYEKCILCFQSNMALRPTFYSEEITTKKNKYHWNNHLAAFLYIWPLQNQALEMVPWMANWLVWTTPTSLLIFSSFDRENGYPERSFAHHDQHSPANISENPYTPELKTNIDTENSHIWKEIHFPNHHFWYLC